MKTLLIIMSFVFVSCGGSDGGGSASDTPASEVNAQSEDNPARNQSITLASVSDLPDCDETIDKQLVYVLDEEMFYLCRKGEWVEVSIKGEDGRDGVDGQDGVTTVVEEEATNKKNQWVDTLTGLTWLIGGGGTYAQAVAACTSGYRVPTWAEAELAIGHGLRAIAASIPATQNFWIDPTGTGQTGAWYATETSGLPNKFQVAATAGYAIYCVK